MKNYFGFRKRPFEKPGKLSSLDSWKIEICRKKRSSLRNFWLLILKVFLREQFHKCFHKLPFYDVNLNLLNHNHLHPSKGGARKQDRYGPVSRLL